MKVDGSEDKELKDLDHGVQDGSKAAKDGIMSEQIFLVDGLKGSGVTENVSEVHGRGLQAPAPVQISQQQQSQGAVVYWEKFLHLRSLKVLLVENDDSTRHVVTALLRNCSYEVIEAANGLRAWKILEDLNNHIDIVLTEVVMPFLPGITLLSKIMSHKTRRNVPVIMMSSHGSMSLVLKCLSKGAVDFLVKPIRKNELKNLWQHVWRRCHSSSGSGSESATQTQKSVRSKSVDKSDNNIGSNDEDDNGSIGLYGDGSDNGSGTESSWTKQVVEINSPCFLSPCDNVVECPDSTCAQVIHSNAELSGSKHLPLTTKTRHCKQEEQLEDIATGKDKVMGMARSLDLQLEYPVEDRMKQKHLPERGSDELSEQPIEKQPLDLSYGSPSSKLKCKNLTGITTKGTDHLNDSMKFEASNKQHKIPDFKNKAICDDKDALTLELSLKRRRGVEDIGTTFPEDRNVLRRSDSSAFSRYNSTLNTNQASGDATRKGSVYDLQSHSCGDHAYQSSNVGSNNIDRGSTTTNTFNQTVLAKNKTSQIVRGKDGDLTGAEVLAELSGVHHKTQIWHHCDYHHLHQSTQQNQLPVGLDNSSLNKLAALAALAPLCGSSNVLCGPAEGNAGNYSINGSASGSNHGSNGQNGSSTAVNAGGTNVESDNRIDGKSGSGDASGTGNGNRVNQSKLAQREAALTKIRQKRKERCFRKKVRYQSRKRLAEQRPRVRGKKLKRAEAKQWTASLTPFM